MCAFAGIKLLLRPQHFENSMVTNYIIEEPSGSGELEFSENSQEVNTILVCVRYSDVPPISFGIDRNLIIEELEAIITCLKANG